MLFYSPQLAAVAALAVLLYALMRVLRYSALRSASGEQIVRSASSKATLWKACAASKCSSFSTRR